jgi:hypothetical protein
LIRTKLRNLTLLAVAVVLVVAWMAQPDGDGEEKDDRWREMSFEIGMSDGVKVGTSREAVYVAIGAELGSSGRYSNARERIWSESLHPGREWSYRFRARVGERLTAQVVSLEGKVGALLCFFYQKGAPDRRGTEHGKHEGFGNITREFSPMTNTDTARCAATVQ